VRWVSALDLQGETIWIVDAHGYGKRFIVRADETNTLFFAAGPDDETHGLFGSITAP